MDQTPAFNEEFKQIFGITPEVSLQYGDLDNEIQDALKAGVADIDDAIDTFAARLSLQCVSEGSQEERDAALLANQQILHLLELADEPGFSVSFAEKVYVNFAREGEALRASVNTDDHLSPHVQLDIGQDGQYEPVGRGPTIGHAISDRDGVNRRMEQKAEELSL